MTREEVELKVVEYAKSVDWDFGRVKTFITKHYDYNINYQEWKILKGDTSDEKTQYIFDKYKPKMKYTIEDLRNGKVAVINEGTLKELKEVLHKAFPNDVVEPSGDGKYYFKYTDSSIKWDSSDQTLLPKQSIKDFLDPKEEEFKSGDVVQVSDDGVHWCEKFYIGKNTQNSRLPYVVTDGVISSWKLCRKPLQKLTLTRAEIAEKFGTTVDKLEIND